MTKLPSKTTEKIITPNGSQICFRLFKKALQPKATILIIPAMAIKQGFYRDLANYLSQQNYWVITFDYNGTGESLHEPLRDNQATLSSWGSNDLTVAIAQAKSLCEDVPLYIIGHSIGGQLLNLAGNNKLIDKYILVACQLPYWRYYHKKDYLKLFSLWFILIPIFSRILNYFPGSRFGLGEDIPKNVALEWSQWARTKNGLFDCSQAYFLKVWKKPGLVYSFSDDWMAPKNPVNALLQKVQATQANWRYIHPKELKEKRIGHFGFFRKRMESTLWKELIQFLNS